jgi:hypothetical protein
MFDREVEDESGYALLEVEEEKGAIIKPGEGRLLLFSLPDEFIRVSFDGLNTISVVPYREQIPSLRQMMNAVIASQLQYLIEDIQRAIKDNSRIFLRRALAIMKKILMMAVFGFLMVYGCMQLSRLMKDLDETDDVIMENAFDALINSCHSVFSAINGTCSVLANDPAICTEKPTNCPSGNCLLVRNLLETCEWGNKKLMEDTHDFFPYSSPFMPRLRDCGGSSYGNYSDACRGHFDRQQKYNGYLFALVVVALAGSFGLMGPLISWFRELDHEPQFTVEERERILKNKFKDFLPREKFEENPAYPLLLDFVTDEDISVGEVLSKLQDYRERGFEYSTQRFFRRPVESSVQIEVEDRDELLRNGA